MVGPGGWMLFALSLVDLLRTPIPMRSDFLLQTPEEVLTAFLGKLFLIALFAEYTSDVTKKLRESSGIEGMSSGP